MLLLINLNTSSISAGLPSSLRDLPCEQYIYTSAELAGIVSTFGDSPGTECYHQPSTFARFSGFLEWKRAACRRLWECPCPAGNGSRRVVNNLAASNFLRIFRVQQCIVVWSPACLIVTYLDFVSRGYVVQNNRRYRSRS